MFLNNHNELCTRWQTVSLRVDIHVNAITTITDQAKHSSMMLIHSCYLFYSKMDKVLIDSPLIPFIYIEHFPTGNIQTINTL